MPRWVDLAAFKSGRKAPPTAPGPLRATAGAAGSGWGRGRGEASDLAGELRLERGLVHHADELLGQLAALEKEHGRDGADAVLRGEIAVVVHVDLCDLQLAVELHREFVEDGGDGLAGAA